MDTNDIAYWVHKISERIKVLADEAMKKYGLTYSQARVLFLVISSSKPLSQKDVKNDLAVAHTTALGVIRRLEKNGFITVTSDSADKRNSLITPTQKAIDLYKDIYAEAFIQQKRIFNGFSDEDIGNFVGLLSRLYENILK